MGHLKSSKIDEKIGYLNKEMKKMGVISEQPANSTSDLYCTTEYIPPVPESPAEFTDVPDPNGVRDAGYVQPSNGYDSNDPNTWENAYPNTDWLYNPNDVAGETDRPVLLSPDTPPTGQTIGRFGPGGGLVRATIGYGMGLGYLKPDNTYQGLLYNSFWGDLYAPTESNRHGGDAPYRGYTDEEYALMQDAYSKMQGTTFGREIKFWDGWSYFWYGNWDSYGGTKKEVAGGAKFVLRTGYISGDPSDYMSKPHENEIPGKTIVLTQHSLDDPNFYPGNPNGFMDFLRNALGVGREALDWLTDAAGETVDNLTNLPSVAETENKIDDAVLAGLDNLNNILDKVNNNPIADTLSWFGGNKQGETIGNFINTVADQVVQHTFGANSSTQYAVQLATKLTASIADGRSHEIKLTGKAKKERINALDLDRLDGNITFGKPDTSVDNAVNPGNKQPFLKGSWGKEGGQEIFYDKDTDTFTILSNKMLRTGAEDTTALDNPFVGKDGTTTDQYDSKGNIIRFGDVPSLSAAELDWADTKLDSVLNDAPPKIQKIINLLPNSQLLDDEQTRKYIINATYDFVVQGPASNVVKLRGWLKDTFNLPDSEMEKTGGGFGHVFSQTSYTGDEIPANVRAVINKNMNQNESYLSEGWESPKHTYIDKNQQKRWFKEKDVAPVYPKKAPPKMIKGYHPDLLPKLDTPIPQIKVKKKDLLRGHHLKKDEAQKLIDLVDRLNDYIKRNPDHLAYARERYPKSDPRLAALNYKMDMQIAAADEYVEKHFPENKRLLNKVLKATKQSIKLTDPKTFKSKDGIFTTFNKLERARHFDNEYKPKERKVIKKRRGKSVSRFFYKPKKKSKYDILKDKMVVLDKEMKKMISDT